jgi:hypothetical protein
LHHSFVILLTLQVQRGGDRIWWLGSLVTTKRGGLQEGDKVVLAVQCGMGLIELLMGVE